MATKINSKNIEATIIQAVFETDPAKKKTQFKAIREASVAQGILPASIQGLYDASGKGLYSGITVPAINIRGITYPVARAVFRSAIKNKVGPFVFEIARSEIDYTDQRPAEYAACVFAAAIRENFRGRVFIQGDHYQVRRAMYRQNAEAELNDIRELIRQSVEAGFYNIDIDASTLVDIEKDDLVEQQAKNSRVTAEMTRFIRGIQPAGVTISVGGEIGEIGKGNSTVADFDAFMKGYLAQVEKGTRGISKISVQTGTSHGGVVLPDGSIAQVSIDFDTLKEISHVARQRYGLGGAVQHGASTLPDEAFDMFPKVGTVEVHLATGFQNIIFDSRHFPDELRQNIYGDLSVRHGDERKQGETEEQFIYKTRKKSFGDFKKDLWNLPQKNLDSIMKELEERFTLMYRKLNVTNTLELVEKHVK
jgi:fructose/tagatose bisphosphate aldolase